MFAECLDAWRVAQIEPPTNAYAFVAAIYLKQEASATLVTNPAPSTETEPVPTPMPIQSQWQMQTNGELTITPTTADTNAPAIADTNISPVIDTNLPPPPPRVVTHEGVVGPVGSIIAPTAYELYDPATQQEIDYLFTTSTNLDISRYDRMRIVVTGEESLAERWGNTPLLTIQRIVVLETNAVPKANYPSPRQRH